MRHLAQESFILHQEPSSYLDLILFGCTIGLVSFFHCKNIIFTTAHALSSIVIIVQAAAQQEARKEAPPSEVIQITKWRSWSLLRGDVGGTKGKGSDKDGAQHSLEKEWGLAGVNLHEHNNQGEKCSDSAQTNTQLGPTAKFVSNKGVHAVVLVNVGGRTHDNNSRGHVSSPNREAGAPRLELALNVKLKRTAQVAGEEGDGTDESGPAEVVQIAVRYGAFLVDGEAVPAVGHDGHQSGPKGGQHEAKQSLNLGPHDKERRYGIEVHQNDNGAKCEGAGGADDGPLLVRFRLGIAALSIVVGLFTATNDIWFI